MVEDLRAAVPSLESERAFQWLTDLVPRLAYKQGHRFSARRLSDDHAKVSLECPALPNADPKNEHVNAPFGLTISESFRLARIQAPSDALQAFASVVARYELHEAAEFLTLDGSSLFLPHRCGDAYGDFTWPDFVDLRGKHLRALCERIEQREL